MIRLENLSVDYGASRILHAISLEIGAGEFVLVSGPSGSGKSTLAHCLAGLIPHESQATLTGKVLVNGLDTSKQPMAKLALGSGLVFQNPVTQLFNATVIEEIAFGPSNLGLPADEIERRVNWALSATNITHLKERSVRALSGGEQQRVAIAATLAMRPQVLILDEPTANLDRQGIEQVTATLTRLHRQENLTIVLIEHRLAAVAPLASRVILLDDGRVVADGEPASILTDKTLLTKLNMRFPWLDREKQLEHIPRPPIVPPADVEPLVRLRAVSAGYGKCTVLSDLDLALYPGQFTALVGENGAGKSSLARLLAGIIRPQQGKIEWHPTLRRMSPGRRAGLLFQNPLHQLVCDRVEDEVSFGPRNYGTQDDLTPLFQAADLVTLRARRPQSLSVGQQQRTALAATLALQPQILILDEPIMGQDWGHLCRLMDYLTQLYRQGQTILLITHDERLVSRYAQHIIRLSGGRIVEKGTLVPATSTCHPRKHQSISLKESAR